MWGILSVWLSWVLVLKVWGAEGGGESVHEENWCDTQEEALPDWVLHRWRNDTLHQD